MEGELMGDIVYVASVLVDSKRGGEAGSEVSLLLTNGDILGGLRAFKVPRLTRDTDYPTIRIEVELYNPNGDHGDGDDETDELDGI